MTLEFSETMEAAVEVKQLRIIFLFLSIAFINWRFLFMFWKMHFNHLNRKNQQMGIKLLKELWFRSKRCNFIYWNKNAQTESSERKFFLREASEGRHTNHNHRKLVNLITRTTALSKSMKLSHAVWGHARRMGHGGEVGQNVVHWRREWQTTSVFLPWEPYEQHEKAKW